MQPVLLEMQFVKTSGESTCLLAKTMFDNGTTAALVSHRFADKLELKGVIVSYWLVVVGHEKVLRSTTLYTLYLEDNSGKKHEVQAYGIDDISEDTTILDLDGVKEVFPGAPVEVYNRPHGPIDLLIGSMYKNLQPWGGEDSCIHCS